MPRRQSETCIVLMANRAYFAKALATLSGLRGLGAYNGDIVLLISSEETLDERERLAFEHLQVITKSFPPIDTRVIDRAICRRPFFNSDGRELTKRFQWHKLHVFDRYFTAWKKVLYLDAGMHILRPVGVFFELTRPGVLLAHSDNYPEYWGSLALQFDRMSHPWLFGYLDWRVNLNRDGFQSTILLFESDLIRWHTKLGLVRLAQRYPLSRTNEQGIMNLYFHGFRKVWSQIPTYFDGAYLYDFTERENIRTSEYTMIKYSRFAEVKSEP